MTMSKNRQAPARENTNTFFSRCLVSKKTLILVFALFFICGALLFDDYGISNDEETERMSSMVNYVNVMGPLMRNSERASVREAAENTPALATYQDRFYGTALQCITVFAEHLFGFQMPEREVYLMRHAFVFLNYFAAGICFCLIIRRRFGNTVLPLLGALAFMLYPRFFGEAFYNIKDSLFFSWMVISGYFTLRWLEERRVRYYCPAAAALAVATNTRILGLSLLLLACAFAAIISIKKKEAFLRAAGRPLALFGLTLAFWVLITPFLWENPVKNIIDTFVLFSNFSNWDGLHLYMGEMITRHVPWHYIPVWMGITIPIPYIAMFFVGTAGICVKAFRLMRNKGVPDAGGRKRKSRKGDSVGSMHAGVHLYDLFMAALFFCTLLGFIALRITMYEGWRHAYGIYFPFIYIAVYGLAAAIDFFKDKHIALRRAGGCAVFASFAFLFGWIIVNHPYEYVFFNSAGRLVAERNFAMDFWDISQTDMVRYVLSRDDRPELMIHSFGGPDILLSDEERERVVITHLTDADYYLRSSREPYESRVVPEGYREEASIMVDGMKISTLYKNLNTEQAQGVADPGARDNIARMASNIDGGDYAVLTDDDPATRWTAGRPQQPGDFLMVEFASPVDYNFFSFGIDGEGAQNYPPELTVHLSEDGYGGVTMPIVKAEGGYRFAREFTPYRLIVFEAGAEAAEAWDIGELSFGYIQN